MSANKPDISQIKKYLQNELDARAMHQLERQAQDDSFLAEAIEGFENAPVDQQENLADLQVRLAQRIEPKKERNIWLWRVLPLAACLLIALLIGYEYLSPKKAKQQQLANVVKPESPSAVSKADTPKHIEEVTQYVPEKRWVAKQQATAPERDTTAASNKEVNVSKALTGKVAGLITYKPDTVEYKASDYKVTSTTTVDELLKHMEGFQVGADGTVTHQGQTVSKARLNGRDYTGGNLDKAIQSLPADVIEKIQVVDDYGDQASMTGVKSGDPTKVLNFTIKPDSVKNKQIAANVDKSTSNALNEVTIVDPKRLTAKKAELSVSTPVGGLAAYNEYLAKNAVLPSGETGTVEVGFIIGDNGTPENVRIINSDSEVLNTKALDLISKGAKWIKGTDKKEIRLKIEFHN